MGLCTKCGVGLVASEEAAGVCYKCANERPDVREAKKAEDAERDAALAAVILTTEAYPAGLVIDKRLEIVTAECVYGMNVFRDLFAGVRGMVGGRSGATQKVLRDARREVLKELKMEACELGADAVVGVSFSYSELSGAGNPMLFLVACGTAVTLE